MLIRPERESAEVAELVVRARQTAEQTRLPIKTFRARRESVVGEPWQRPVEFLEPIDARKLYRRLHRSRVLVLTFTRVYVRRDPSRQPVVRRAALELGTFVEHKAAFELIRSKKALDAILIDFRAVGNTLRCTGEDDPRCLPLHAFSVDRNWSVLSEQVGRDAFAKLYGPARSRVDGARKRWTRADRGAYHGGEALVVAGNELMPGMHWDVTSERRLTRLTTSDEIWKVPHETRGHLNVFPDAYVKPGQGARRVWPKK